MSLLVKSELNRMRRLFLAKGIELPFWSSVTSEYIEKIEREIGVRFDDDIKAFYKLTNGSNWVECGTVKSDQLMPVAFLSLEWVVKYWKQWCPYNANHYKRWSLNEHDAQLCDKRVKPYFHHKRWIPIADFNNGYITVYFDADPQETGKYGQIIVYQHGPDSINYLADSFIDFLKKSNDLVENSWDELFEYKL